MTISTDNSESGLSHVDAGGRPRMVDVGGKAVTRRTAVAAAQVVFPPEVFAELERGQFRAGKGAVIDTAVIAGTMAAKRTHELIPFCHPLAVEKVVITIEPDAALPGLDIRCQVAVSGRTGVEMEALTGASVAALTVYDMCKALSHAIRIEGVRLLSKHGGRRDVVDGALEADEPEADDGG